MLPLYLNIKEKRKKLGMSQEQLAKLVGYTDRSSIAKIEKGNVDLSQSKILEFAKALKTTPSELMGWSDEEDYLKIDNIIPVPKMEPLPIIGTIACGEPILANENIDGYFNVEKSLKADFCLRCKGDSMINARIYDSDLVFIKKQPDVEDGEIAAVLIDNEATLKRVYKVPGRIILRAENPTFKPIELKEEDMKDIRIIGKAVGFCSKL
ncbi:transcriptional repressor LexA [Anaerofustis butyriciformans]|uniref:transcriptional repressor LexA n=1 Tax=Anaerofustis butyriciformans TaxID=3108533 RepID=UPI002E348423|nr:transcriptional repressor LexA [Anaerofustis sp. HA2171]